MGRRHDAALALGVLLAVGTAAALLDAPADPFAAGVGATGALAAEATLSRRSTLVRRVWERRGVQVGATTLALGGGVVGTLTVGPRALTALTAALVAYLGVLVVVGVRVRAVSGLGRTGPSARLRRRALTTGLVALLATAVVGAGLLASAAVDRPTALAWGLVASGVLGAQFVVLARNLGANRRVGAAGPNARLGAANLATLGRAVLVAWLAGFLVVPWLGGVPWLAWGPAGLYVAAVLLDAVDGTLARRLGSTTELGARLDGHVDGVGVLAGVGVGVTGGLVPPVLLVVGLAKGGYLVAESRRRRRGGRLRPLPERGSRRLLAVLQMLATVVVLFPAVGRTASTLVAGGAGAVYVAGFLRDWRLRTR